MTYKTSDLPLITALVLKRYDYISCRREKGKVFFIFEKTRDLENLVERFYNNDLKVDARYFAYQLRKLRRIIYDVLKE